MPCSRFTLTLKSEIGRRSYCLCNWLTIHVQFQGAGDSTLFALWTGGSIAGRYHSGFAARPSTIHSYTLSRKVQETLRLAYEIARRNRRERAKQLSIKIGNLSPIFKSEQQVLLGHPFCSMNKLNPKLQCPWRGPRISQAQSCPVVCRVKTAHPDAREVYVRSLI